MFDIQAVRTASKNSKTNALLYKECCLCDVSKQDQFFIRHYGKEGQKNSKGARALTE